MNLSACGAIAVCEFTLQKGHGYVDYLLFLDGSAVGVCDLQQRAAILKEQAQ